MRSEIFNEFVKIAQEQKIISNDSKKSRQALEKNPRADSLDITAIEALYGVKPTSIPELKYKNNIMEVAHPDSLVISPAYDKINGLVENNIERQNINLRIVNKNPDGLLTQRKYAEQQFLLSLVRVANDLDNKDEHSLLSLADHCLHVASKTFIKNAVPIIGALASRYVIGGIIGALYLYNHLPSLNEGFPLNSKTLIEKVEALENVSIDYEVGYTLKPEFKSNLGKFKKFLKRFEKKYNKYKKIFDKVEGLDSSTFDDAENLAQTKPVDTNEILKAYDAFKIDVEKVKARCERVKNALSKPRYINAQIQQRGTITEIADKTGLLTSSMGLFSNKFNDIVRTIPNYIASVEELMTILKQADDKKLEAAEQYEEDAMEGADDDDITRPANDYEPTPTSRPGSPDDETPTGPMPRVLRMDSPANENVRMQAAAKFNLNNLFKK